MSNPPATNQKLGQMLVERGWITGEQLIRAIQSQRVVGGRIGTCLLEMDVLTEDKLLEALSSQLGVPSAQIEELRSIDSATLKLVPSKVAARWQAVPLSAGRNDVRVATLNVKNLACLDELEFASNKRVLPHIANEARIFEALERYYGIECPRRYGHLLDRLNRSRYMWDESAEFLLGAGQTEHRVIAQAEPPLAGNGRRAGELMRPPTSRSTLTLGGREPAPPARNGAITWPTVTDQDAGSQMLAKQSADEPPIPTTLTLDDVERLLAGQSDQKMIGRTILRFLGQSFSRSAIFAVRNDCVRGWLYHGEGIDGALFNAAEIKLDQPSAFLGLIKGAEFFIGPLAPMPAHRELARCWGGELPQQCLMMPVRLRGRLISVLYGDRGADALESVSIDQMRELSEKASIAFELCILRRKLRKRTVSRPSGGPR